MRRTIERRNQVNRKEKTRLTLGALLLLSVCAGSADVYAEKTTDDDENTRESSQTYVTRDVEVEGEAARDYFGNEITEQSYYRTGGDVTVIDRKTLDRRHYDQLTDALRQVPGVLIRTPGYRGGEFQNGNTHSVVSINGDDRVVVLVDGRRMDNAAGNVTTWDSVGNTKATVDINQIININGIEKIEVMKGPGASFYGSDATGGVINIITRKGEKKPVGTLDLSTGSWGRHNYRLSYSGSTVQNRLKYFVSLSREMSGDTQYKDGLTGKTYRYLNSGYKDEAVNLRLDYDFDKQHSLRVSYNHMQSDADYPYTAPDYRYWNPTDWHRIINGSYAAATNPGSRNRWYIWAATGAYNAYNKNNTDLTYTPSTERTGWKALCAFTIKMNDIGDPLARATGMMLLCPEPRLGTCG